MNELWQFFKQDYWDHFQNEVVKSELPKHLDFLSELEKDSPFDDDTNKALANLSSYMFRNEIGNYKSGWIKKFLHLTEIILAKLPNK